MQGKNQIATICRELPLAMVKFHGMKSKYTYQEIDNVWDKKFNTRHNIKYAYAMFYAYLEDEAFVNNLDDVDGLRNAVAKQCGMANEVYSLDALVEFAKVEMSQLD